MPEVWIPYGEVETLVSVEAENIGSIVNPDAEKSTGETDRLSEKLRGAAHLFLCDSAPTTVELVRVLLPVITATQALKITAKDPRRMGIAVPELKSRFIDATMAAPAAAQEGQLAAEGAKVFLGTARPDPLFGLVDPKVAACLNWIPGSGDDAAQRRRDMEPTPFEKTDAYARMEELASQIPGASCVTIIPRSGRVRSVMEDAPFDAVRNGFYNESVAPAKALIVGAGGSGYDETLSAALRSLWGALGCVKKSGEILLLAECAGGLGSRALEMLVTGRIGSEGGRRREKYVPGLEEVYYLQRLKEDYDVMLLSGLPELYAKSKMGFATAKGSGEAVGRLLSKAGRASKINVVARAGECRLESA